MFSLIVLKGSYTWCPTRAKGSEKTETGQRNIGLGK